MQGVAPECCMLGSMAEKIARFSDVCEKQFSSLAANRDRIERFLKEALSA